MRPSGVRAPLSMREVLNNDQHDMAKTKIEIKKMVIPK
jgi:hypothetical protein